MKSNKNLPWGPGGYRKLVHKKANIWLTATIVLAIVVVYIFAMITALLGSPYNISSANLLSRYSSAAAVKRLTFAALLAPHNPIPIINLPINQNTITFPPTSALSSAMTQPPATTAPTTTPPALTQPSVISSQPPVMQPPTTQPPAGQSLIAPTAGAKWPKGSIQTIRWTAGIANGAGIALRLEKGGQRFSGASSVIAGGGTGPYGDVSGEFIRNNGAFDWVVPNDLPVGTDYSIQLITPAGQAVAESSIFSVTAASNAFQFVAPVAGEHVGMDTDYALRWKNPVNFTNHVDVAIYQKSRGFNGLSYIAKNVPASWLYIVDGKVFFTWSINAGNNLAQSNGNGGLIVPGDAVVIVSSPDNRSLSGQSASFTIQ